MKLLTLSLLGLLLGLLTVLVLPYLVLVAFVAAVDRLLGADADPLPLRCDGGEGQAEHPFFVEWERLEAQRQMRVDTTPFVDMAAEAARQTWVSKVEQMLQKRKGKE